MIGQDHSWYGSRRAWDGQPRCTPSELIGTQPWDNILESEHPWECSQPAALLPWSDLRRGVAYLDEVCMLRHRAENIVRAV